MRMEVGFALVASLINNAMGGKAKLDDFVVHKDEEQPASMEQVFGMIKAQANRGKP